MFKAALAHLPKGPFIGVSNCASGSSAFLYFFFGFLSLFYKHTSLLVLVTVFKAHLPKGPFIGVSNCARAGLAHLLKGPFIGISN